MTDEVDIVEEFNKKPLMLKRRILGMAERYQTDVLDVERDILKERYKGHTVVGIINDIAVVQEISPTFPEAPYTISLEKGGKWCSTEQYYNSIDQALLGALGHKYHGPNSQFEFFAMKMLKD